ncbi:hypothetical protein PHMEG_00013121 [Phytophthora megakarya]|uniref:Uncharacterized protein n=1 Tax=Phytophthora megakarya TaxID=4795 RepID=A0A225W8I1_9STRA|nr:hypothetical protein PHMEG_00013121 [Phytophthora megakarya]
MRSVLAVNPSSAGLQHLDEIASALLENDHDAAADFFDSLIVLVPDSARQRSGGVPPDHEVFTENLKRSRSTTPPPTGAVLVPKKGSHLEADLAEFVDFPVSEAAVLAVKRAVVKLYKEAKGNGQVLALKAYPWRGQYLFYDPSESPDVCLVHWRWWMNGRLAFFLWGLNVPLEGRVAQAARRRKKSDAIAGRIDGHRLLFWWGGQPGRNQPSSEYKGPKIMDMGVLLKNDDVAFLQRLRDARKPGRLDREGFRDLPSLLALTGAIDPDDKGERSPELRLSDRALARVLLDVTSTLQVPEHWSGNITEGLWLALTKSERIRDLRIVIEKELAAGTYVLPTVEQYDPAESEVEDVNPFKNRDGLHTALPPKNKVAPWSYK